MRYFDQALVNSSRPHQQWWGETCMQRDWFMNAEQQMAPAVSALPNVHNASPILPREAWAELDAVTRRILRDDEGQAYMADLMPLARAVHIGKLVHMYRVVGDAGTVHRSMSGQIPNTMDKVQYDYRGTPVPIFSTAYGREWREWNTFQSENFDPLIDDQEAHAVKLRENMADYALFGDSEITFQGFTGAGILNHEFSLAINLGTGAGGAAIDLTTATADELDAFFTGPFGAMLDANLVSRPVNLYISPEIARAWDRSYSGSAGVKDGTVLEYIQRNRRIGKVTVTYKLTGNAFFGFVPDSQFIRPLVGMAVSTVPTTRMNPTDNYQFTMMGAMGIEIRADINGKSGVFHSVEVNA